jgi:hypothetical protein
MKTETTTTGLTSNDVKALRTADVISLHFVNGVSTIAATKNLKTAGPFDERERRHTISVSGFVTDYRNEYSYSRQEEYKCFAMVYGYNEVWATVASLLKPNDLITLHWIGGNDSQNLKNGGLTQDLLKLEVKRGDKKLVFHVEDSIVPPHSTAKMVQRG